MSSRYYNNQYLNAPPYGSPYRTRYYSQKPSSKGKPRSTVVRDGGHIPGPYSPTLGRKKPVGHWKAKKRPNKEDPKKTKLGEFNQESIEAELNKYKKGVFYHDDEPKINGHSTKQQSMDRYSQYQLTRTQQAAPQPYDDLPRPVPPNYDERVKTKDRVNDDSKSREEDKQKAPATKQESKKRKSRVGRSRGRKTVTVAPPYGRGYAQDYYYYPQQGDYYYGQSSRYPAAASADYPYGYTTNTSVSYPYDHGVIQDDGSWYPYPDVLQQQQAQAQPQAYVDPYATPKHSRNGNRKVDSANVDLTTPLRTGGGEDDSNKRMSPGRRVNKIQKQLEYYFSPQNMNNDEFLRDSMDNNGWVNIEVIVAFNRMKVLGATKDLVVEAAYHSTTIEIDSKNPDKIRMTKLWKQYISDKNKRKERERKREKRVSASKQKEKELDEAELNQQTIESIVAAIERKQLKRKKRRQEREKEKEKEKEKKEKETEEDNKEEAKEKEEETETTKEKAKEEDGDDMVEID